MAPQFFFATETQKHRDISVLLCFCGNCVLLNTVVGADQQHYFFSNTNTWKDPTTILGLVFLAASAGRGS